MAQWCISIIDTIGTKMSLLHLEIEDYLYCSMYSYSYCIRWFNSTDEYGIETMFIGNHYEEVTIYSHCVDMYYNFAKDGSYDDLY